MHVLVTCKNEDDSVKNEGARVVTTFSHYKSMVFFPDPQGQLTLHSLVRSDQISNSFEALWLSLLSAIMKNIQSKMKAQECSQHYTLIFQAPKGSLLHVEGSCRNSNLSKLLSMSSLPARMKKIQLKMKALDCSQDLSDYKSMGIFPDAQVQLTLQWSDLVEF